MIDTVTSIDEYGNPMLSFKVKFTDPVDEKNYYLVKIRNTYDFEKWDENLIIYDTLYVGPDTTIINEVLGGNVISLATENIWFSSNDLIIEEYMWSTGVIFSDEIINGENYSFSGKMNKWSLYGTENNVSFELRSLSPETFKYYKSVNQHYDTSGDPFAEPVIVFTNIENGIGIFGSSTAYKDSIIIDASNNNPHIEY
jgi:hypothetical protein